MVGAIVAFRMRITRLEAKFKLSQNRIARRPRARRSPALAREGYAEAHATADWMRALRDTGDAAADEPTLSRTSARSGADDRRASRFDKWLWAARFYKTRSLAAQAIDAGQVRVGGERVKPARADARRRAVSRAQVRNRRARSMISRCRIGAAAPPMRALLYRETRGEPRGARGVLAAAARRAKRASPRFPGRPTKRQRRKLEDFLNEP